MKSNYTFAILNRHYCSKEFEPTLISRNYARSSNLRYWYKVRPSRMEENWYILLLLQPRGNLSLRHASDRNMLKVGRELGIRVCKNEK